MSEGDEHGIGVMRAFLDFHQKERQLMLQGVGREEDSLDVVAAREQFERVQLLAVSPLGELGVCSEAKASTSKRRERLS